MQTFQLFVDTKEMKRLVAQTLCLLASEPIVRSKVVGAGSGRLLVDFLHSGDSLLQREAICTLHYLACDENNRLRLVNAGVYDTSSMLGSHSDPIIKRCCEAILELLSPLIKDFKAGTVGRVISLCMEEDSGATRGTSG